MRNLREFLQSEMSPREADCLFLGVAIGFGMCALFVIVLRVLGWMR